MLLQEKVSRELKEFQKGLVGMKQTRTWLITGCSTGIGRGIAEAVLQKGENAVVTARDKSRVKDFEERYPGKALAVTLDMERPETIAQAVEQAQERFGSVDVLINNAGHGYRAALEKGEPAAVAELFQTNFFGPVELIKRVLPAMREQKYGVIVNVSSIGAVNARPGQRLLWGLQSGAGGGDGQPAPGGGALGDQGLHCGAGQLPHRLLR